MANEAHLTKLREGVRAWNEWRAKITDPIILHGADLSGANLIAVNLGHAFLSHVNLSGANLRSANLEHTVLSNGNLSGANLTYANFYSADLPRADLSNANLSNANLFHADLSGANLCGSNLSEAKLTNASLHNTDLSNANLSNVNLELARLVGTNVANATLTGCRVYGISAWNLQGEPKEQNNLVISESDEPAITLDDLEVAQFIYLLTKNEKLRNVIDTMTSKVVLLLGRFTPEREPTLAALRDELRHHDYVPVVFDFDKPDSATFITTISTIARMAQFIIADFTDPRMVPVEVQHIADTGAAVPILPIRMASEKKKGEHIVLIGLKKTHGWMILDTFWYEDIRDLITSVKRIIEPAKAIAQEAIQGDRERSEKLVQAIKEKRQQTPNVK